MRPVSELSNQEKAKYLHDFLPEDIKTIIECIEHGAQYILNNKKEIKQHWTSKLISIDDWFFLADETNKKIKEHRKQLTTDSQFFADQLFAGYMGIFSLHCIQQYINTSSNQRLIDGIKFFFDLIPRTPLTENR